MSRHRFHIALLILFFSLLGPLHVLDVCLMKHEIPAKSTSQTPNSVSCLDGNEESLFLYQTSFPRTEKRALDACGLVSWQGGIPHRTVLHASGAVFVLSVPIYQSKTVYQI